MRLVNVFTDRIKPAAGIRYNISWTFGGYLDHVPAHLGVNEALDAATAAFMVGMRRFPNPASSVDLAPVMLEKYTLALAALRRCLDDPVVARAPETLCAVLFLLNCQVRGSSPFSRRRNTHHIINSNSCRTLLARLPVMARGPLKSSSYEAGLKNLMLSKDKCFLLCVELL